MKRRRPGSSDRQRRATHRATRAKVRKHDQDHKFVSFMVSPDAFFALQHKMFGIVPTFRGAPLKADFQ